MKKENNNPFSLYEKKNNKEQIDKTTVAIMSIIDKMIVEINKTLKKSATEIQRLDKKGELGITDTASSEDIAGYFEKRLQEKESQQKLTTRKYTIVDTFFSYIH